MFLSMFWSCLLAAFLIYVPLGFADHDDDVIEVIHRHHANKKGGWTAKRNHLSGKSMHEKKQRTGLILAGREIPRDVPHISTVVEKPADGMKRAALPSIPANFDSRTAWPNCATIQEVRDQGRCGSCYAHAAASVISDRICISSGTASTYFHASVQDLITCGGGSNNGCDGGLLRTPYLQYMQRGVVSGGNYNNNTGCMPYTSYTPAAANATTSTSCNSLCTNTAYGKTFQQDLSFASNYYGLGLDYGNYAGGAAGTITSQSVVTQMQYEIMTNGPLSVQVTVYNDFMSYGTGVYQYVTGAAIGGHALKLIGWGHNATIGQDYWIIANSWNTGWGMGGFAYILRGVNMIGIENNAVGATPQPTGSQSPPIPPRCGPNGASLAFCQGKYAYAVTTELACSNQYCVCPAADWTSGGIPIPYPFLWSCDSGLYFDPTPNALTCNAHNSIPACTDITTTTAQPKTTSAPVPDMCLPQDNTWQLSCWSGTVTTVTSALWGTTCGSSSAACPAVNVTAAVIRQCTPAATTCSFTSTNAALNTTDPCPSVSKSLAIFTTCTPVSSSTISAQPVPTTTPTTATTTLTATTTPTTSTKAASAGSHTPSTAVPATTMAATTPPTSTKATSAGSPTPSTAVLATTTATIPPPTSTKATSAGTLTRATAAPTTTTATITPPSSTKATSAGTLTRATAAPTTTTTTITPPTSAKASSAGGLTQTIAAAFTTTTRTTLSTTTKASTTAATTSSPAVVDCLPGNYMGNFSCNAGYVVTVFLAFFGTSCGPASPGCVASDVTAAVKQQCTPGNRWCLITAANSYYTPDPCPGVLKNLAVDWNCIWSPVPRW